MKDYLIIRVNREAFRDHSLEELGAKRYLLAIKRLEGLAEGLGMELSVTVNTSLDWVRYDSMADVYCTKALGADEKQAIAESLKEFMKDRASQKSKLYQIGFRVFFHPLDADDILEVEGDAQDGDGR